MTAKQFITSHKKEMLWGAVFGVIVSFVGSSIVAIINFLNMVMDYVWGAMIWIIELIPKIATALGMTGNTIVLLIVGAVLGAFLGIIIKPIFDFLVKIIKKSPV